MFERFSERARLVVVLAQDEARALRHNYIGTEHLLLGLLREESGLGARVLGSFGLSLEAARRDVRRIVGEGDDVADGQIPFTPRAKQVLELALREALGMNHPDISSEHILLGLLSDGDGVANRIMDEYGATAGAARDRVTRLLGALGSPLWAGREVPGVGFYPEEPITPPTTAWVGIPVPLPDRLRDWLPLATGAAAFGAGLAAGRLIWG